MTWFFGIFCVWVLWKSEFSKTFTYHDHITRFYSHTFVSILEFNNICKENKSPNNKVITTTRTKKCWKLLYLIFQLKERKVFLGQAQEYETLKWVNVLCSLIIGNSWSNIRIPQESFMIILNKLLSCCGKKRRRSKPYASAVNVLMLSLSDIWGIISMFNVRLGKSVTKKNIVGLESFSP